MVKAPKVNVRPLWLTLIKCVIPHFATEDGLYLKTDDCSNDITYYALDEVEEDEEFDGFCTVKYFCLLGFVLFLTADVKTYRQVL